MWHRDYHTPCAILGDYTIRLNGVQRKDPSTCESRQPRLCNYEHAQLLSHNIRVIYLAQPVRGDAMII